MGLSISYELCAATDAKGARTLVATARDAALEMEEFDEVHELNELGAPDGPARDRDLDPEIAELVSFYGSHFVEREVGGEERIWVGVKPLHAVMFRVRTRGAETALLGLASHPTSVQIEHQGVPLEVEMGEPGVYRWRGWCKTQYAGLPGLGGTENFLRAHGGLIALLERLQEIGFEVTVRDDGEFWETGDTAHLLAKLEEHNAGIAALAGLMKDSGAGRWRA